jgi:hypothetical protein
MKSKKTIYILSGVALLVILGCIGMVILLRASIDKGNAGQATTDDGLVFIHHSVGAHWLRDGLVDALRNKEYISEYNNIGYGVGVLPDAGRPNSLGLVTGDHTDMNHWIFWFNDYLNSVKTNRHNNPGRIDRLVTRIPGLREYYFDQKRDAYASGTNKIVMFKSCFPNSDLVSAGDGSGNPFDSQRTIANHQAVFRHPDGAGHTYTYDGTTYKALEDIFAENPDTLFVFVTAPPLHYAPTDGTTDTHARNSRAFNNWLKNDWLPDYNAAHPKLNNVVVFDFFDVLANSDDDSEYPNRLRAEFGGESGDSHPNETANHYATEVFATNADNFIDAAWQTFDSE